jgi:predicted phosphodiesterase
MRTLVVSDLHLGTTKDADVLRRPAPLARLQAAVAGVDRLVLLGDVVELRMGPAREAMPVARRALAAVAEALGPDAEVVVVPGNHDHALVAPWLDRRGAPLGLEERVTPADAGALGAELAEALGTARTSFAYPGLWLRDDVYAMHGHFGDVHGTVPTFERLAAGVMQRLGARLPDGPLTPGDYERILAPLYAWSFSAAQRTGDGGQAAGADRATAVYELLTGDGRHPLHLRLLARGFPTAVRLLSMGMGPLDSDVTPEALRRNGLRATAETVHRLGIPSAHVVFGHTHRRGPLPGDAAWEWRWGPTRLHNAGCWVHDPVFLRSAGRSSPYWPGGAIVLEDGTPPRTEGLLADLDEADVSPRAPARG